MTTSSRMFSRLVAAASLALLSGCLSRTVGSTATTVAPGETRTSASVAAGLYNDRRDLGSGVVTKQFTGYPSLLELETRFGLTPRSDVGLRITGLSEVLASYKVRIAGSNEASAVAVQISGGAAYQGLVPTAGVTLLASGDQRRRTSVYGGLRFQALKSLSDDVDLKQLGNEGGGFFGWQLRRGSWVFLPEIAVLKGNNFLRDDPTLLVIPAITFRRDRSK
ncbi:MAG: hypothetical protein IT353_17435 [Gemmatimonadaceae bacterium]|nr:hypothetical protein [Gemmatimonadaceae bacterium]